MKHATASTLATLTPLLDAIRKFSGLKERSLGVFYRNSQAFLHFHEDPAGIFADVRGGGDWERFPLNTAAERAHMLKHVRALLG